MDVVISLALPPNMTDLMIPSALSVHQMLTFGGGECICGALVFWIENRPTSQECLGQI